LTIADVEVAEFDALVLPGGVINPDALRTDPQAVALVQAFVAAGKPVAAICHGPWLLVEADVLRGRRATGWRSIRTDLRNAGAELSDERVVRDGTLITAQAPEDVAAFTEALIAAIEER
jgi:protease I